MTAGTDQPAAIKMSESPQNKTISLQNSNSFSEKIDSGPSSVNSNKDVVNSVRKNIKFATDNQHFSENSSQNLNGQLNSCQNVSEHQNIKSEVLGQNIRKCKYVPGRDGDPVLQDHRILLGNVYFRLRFGLVNSL